MNEAGFVFVRLDGSMPQAKRALALERFKSDSEVAVGDAWGSEVPNLIPFLFAGLPHQLAQWRRRPESNRCHSRDADGSLVELHWCEEESVPCQPGLTHPYPSAVEEQAIDRVHRIGQVKDVVVKRFVIANSVEDKVLQLQERKKRLARETLKAGGKADGGWGRVVD